MNAKNYDMPAMRRELITLLANSLNRSSRFYADDYETICRNVNRMTLRQLRETLSRQRAIAEVTTTECRAHCQF